MPTTGSTSVAFEGPIYGQRPISPKVLWQLEETA
jgi:hypothetical protein